MPFFASPAQLHSGFQNTGAFVFYFVMTYEQIPQHFRYVCSLHCLLISTQTSCRKTRRLETQGAILSIRQYRIRYDYLSFLPANFFASTLNVFRRAIRVSAMQSNYVRYFCPFTPETCTHVT